MAISGVQVIDTQHTAEPANTPLNTFTAAGGQAPSATTPAVTQTQVVMSGAGDYAVGGYSLTAAQLGFATAVLGASVNGPTGSPTQLPGCPPWSASGAAASAQYNTSTNKLQFFGANGSELTLNAVVGGSWLVVARGY